ncbi:MAG TPA: hypothetical protein VLA24_08485, partial [Pseudomonadales bacterium]|nr:hypothetical protein [Pseudomonadales bacterium]
PADAEIARLFEALQITMKIAPALLFVIFPFVAVANGDGLKQIADAAKSRSIGSDSIDFGPPTPLPVIPPKNSRSQK